MKKRNAKLNRKTAETEISCTLSLDGTGKADINTGIGFLDHMINALACHAKFDIALSSTGDMEVDDHHTAEDCALVLGECIEQALGDKVGIRRFGCGYAPMDEALCRVVIDCSGRPFASVNLAFAGPRLGDLATENVSHFFISFATAAKMTIHVDLLRGVNDHHRAESAFKALALALSQAVAVDSKTLPSTKGVL